MINVFINFLLDTLSQHILDFDEESNFLVPNCTKFAQGVMRLKFDYFDYFGQMLANP